MIRMTEAVEMTLDQAECLADAGIKGKFFSLEMEDMANDVLMQAEHLTNSSGELIQQAEQILYVDNVIAGIR